MSWELKKDNKMPKLTTVILVLIINLVYVSAEVYIALKLMRGLGINI
jgi:hypothetical protein